MEPVHWKVKIVFHVFGFGGFIVTLLLLVFTGKAKDCVSVMLFLSIFKKPRGLAGKIIIFMSDIGSHCGDDL